jgi:predicted N-acetyltransferase YhbS
VALNSAEAIVGYYTFAAAGIPFSDLPAEITNRLPRYPNVPAGLIGRLAVDQRLQGQRMGEALLFDAVVRAVGSAPAVFALVVDAKDERAATFYKRFRFQPFPSQPFKLFLPIATAKKMLPGG